MESLEGIRFLVTGAASPIGSALLEEFARGGASLLAADADEDELDAAIARLAEPDDVFSHVLEGDDVVSWWDLTNLVAAYFHCLNVFIHIARPLPEVPVRALRPDALGAAMSATVESFITAIARLEKYLVEAAREDRFGAYAVIVVPFDSRPSVPGSLCLASATEYADALTRAYRGADLDIRVHAISADRDKPSEVIATLARVLSPVD